MQEEEDEEAIQPGEVYLTEVRVMMMRMGIRETGTRAMNQTRKLESTKMEMRKNGRTQRN